MNLPPLPHYGRLCQRRASLQLNWTVQSAFTLIDSLVRVLSDTMGKILTIAGYIIWYIYIYIYACSCWLINQLINTSSPHRITSSWTENSASCYICVLASGHLFRVLEAGRVASAPCDDQAWSFSELHSRRWDSPAACTDWGKEIKGEIWMLRVWVLM